MPTQADVRRIALTLDGTVEEPGRFAFGVPVKFKINRYAKLSAVRAYELRKFLTETWRVVSPNRAASA